MLRTPSSLVEIVDWIAETLGGAVEADPSSLSSSFTTSTSLSEAEASNGLVQSSEGDTSEVEDEVFFAVIVENG